MFKKIGHEQSGGQIVKSQEISIFIIGLGAKSQNLSSVAPPRKNKLVTIFSQGHVWGP